MVPKARTAIAQGSSAYLEVKSTLTAGVDLAAETRGTALAVIDWSVSAARVVELVLGASDTQIAAIAPDVSSLGIDCAFGWPDEFVAFVTGHSAGNRLERSREDLAGSEMDWRRRLAYRETDRATRKLTGRWPLSVATDRLGLTALHCAVLLDLIGGTLGGTLGRTLGGTLDGTLGAGPSANPNPNPNPIDRSGFGIIAEVYPSATLRGWGFSTVGYKADATVRSTLLAAIVERAPWLELDRVADLMVASDDAFDAVIAALAARAHSLGLWHRPPEESLDRARREGWIVLPTVDLAALRPA